MTKAKCLKFVLCKYQQKSTEVSAEDQAAKVSQVAISEGHGKGIAKDSPASSQGAPGLLAFLAASHKQHPGVRV